MNNNLSALFTCIDFKKEFDFIHRSNMDRVLRSCGIPDKLVNAINVIYANTRTTLYSPHDVFEEFDIVAGVL